jgi:hypothetical protein
VQATFGPVPLQATSLLLKLLLALGSCTQLPHILAAPMQPQSGTCRHLDSMSRFSALQQDLDERDWLSRQQHEVWQLINSERGVCGGSLAFNSVNLVPHIAFFQSLACAGLPYQQDLAPLRLYNWASCTGWQKTAVCHASNRAVQVQPQPFAVQRSCSSLASRGPCSSHFSTRQVTRNR